MNEIKELLASPGFMSQGSTMGSDISYFFAVTFILMFIYAGSLATKGMGLRHHRMILLSLVVMTAYFIFYYLVRRLGLESLADRVNFQGYEWVYRDIFKPVLYTHMVFVTITFFLSIYMIINGFATAVTIAGEMKLKSEPAPRSKVLWLTGLLWLGFLIWWIFSSSRFGVSHQVMFLALGYLLPAMLAFAIGYWLSDSARRHRIMGRLCILAFIILFITSALVYYLLYIFNS